MSLFDRFTSQKGKEQTSKPKAGTVKATKKAEADKKQAFANVPAGETKATKKEKAVAAPAAAAKTETSGHAYRVLIRPVVTEKSTMYQSQGRYTFMIAPEANKVDVRQAVQHLYGVRPTAVNIVRLPGKIVRYGRSTGRTVVRKKAIVTLPAGKTLDLAK